MGKGAHAASWQILAILAAVLTSWQHMCFGLHWLHLCFLLCESFIPPSLKTLSLIPFAYGCSNTLNLLLARLESLCSNSKERHFNQFRLGHIPHLSNQLFPRRVGPENAIHVCCSALKICNSQRLRRVLGLPQCQKVLVGMHLSFFFS